MQPWRVAISSIDVNCQCVLIGHQQADFIARLDALRKQQFLKALRNRLVTNTIEVVELIVALLPISLVEQPRNNVLVMAKTDSSFCESFSKCVQQKANEVTPDSSS